MWAQKDEQIYKHTYMHASYMHTYFRKKIEKSGCATGLKQKFFKSLIVHILGMAEENFLQIWNVTFFFF